VTVVSVPVFPSGCNRERLQLEHGLINSEHVDDTARENNTERIIRISEYDQFLFRSRPLWLTDLPILGSCEINAPAFAYV
jgi:hypothetical protein